MTVRLHLWIIFCPYVCHTYWYTGAPPSYQFTWALVKQGQEEDALSRKQCTGAGTWLSHSSWRWCCRKVGGVKNVGSILQQWGASTLWHDRAPQICINTECVNPWSDRWPGMGFGQGKELGCVLLTFPTISDEVHVRAVRGAEHRGVSICSERLWAFSPLQYIHFLLKYWPWNERSYVYRRQNSS